MGSKLLGLSCSHGSRGNKCMWTSERKEVKSALVLTAPELSHGIFPATWDVLESVMISWGLRVQSHPLWYFSGTNYCHQVASNCSQVGHECSSVSWAPRIPSHLAVQTLTGHSIVSFPNAPASHFTCPDSLHFIQLTAALLYQILTVTEGHALRQNAERDKIRHSDTFYTLVHWISFMYKVQTEESKSRFCKLNTDVTVQPAVSYCWLSSWSVAWCRHTVELRSLFVVFPSFNMDIL